MSQSRQLAAIMFTDIVGYTALMQENEGKAVAWIKHYNDALNRNVSLHEGRVLNYYGDGSLCTFSSITEAVTCAIELQKDLQSEPPVPLRIGLHVGEVFFEEGNALGDAVNITSRIQSLGQANTILFSKEVFDKIRNQLEFNPVSLGVFAFKNVTEPIEVFAMANDGLYIPKRDTLEGKLTIEGKKNSSRKLLAGMIIFFALVFIGIPGYYKYLGTKKIISGEKSIAILPFKIIGDNKDNVSEGLVEDILVRLSKIKDLKVISNRSSVRYAESKKSIKEIGEELGATTLVTGSVQQIENTIHVSSQLIECISGKTLWANVYDRELKKVFDIQSEVALQIVDALKTNLTADEKRNLSKRYTDNVDAYKFYRKGRSFWDKRTKESFDSAKANYLKAIQLDPDYAIAYVGLADCYTINEQGLPQLVSMPIAREYVNKALALDSTLAEALTTDAFIQGVFDYELKNCKANLEKAIRFDPNYATAHLYYGNAMLQYVGNPDIGLYENKKALELDPLSVNVNYVLGRNYYFANKLDSAYTQLRKALILGPGFNFAKAYLAHTLIAKKNYAEAFDVIHEIPRTGTSNFQEYQGSLLSYAYAAAGERARASLELTKTLQENPNQLSYHIAGVYTILNNYDSALARLEQSYKLREISMVFLKVDPVMDPLRKEPRFKMLMKKIGFE